MLLPNNLNIRSYRSFFCYGEAIAFFVIHSRELVLVKTQLPFECMETYTTDRLFGDNWSLRFSVRQLRLSHFFVGRRADFFSFITEDIKKNCEE